MTGALQAPVAVGEQDVTIGIEEIGGPESAEFSSEVGHQRQSRLDAGFFVRRPQFSHARQQSAEGMLGIGLTDRVMVTKRQCLTVEGSAQVAVVREHLSATVEFAQEGLRVGQRHLPLCGRADGKWVNSRRTSRERLTPVQQTELESLPGWVWRVT